MVVVYGSLRVAGGAGNDDDAGDVDDDGCAGCDGDVILCSGRVVGVVRRGGSDQTDDTRMGGILSLRPFRPATCKNSVA